MMAQNVSIMCLATTCQGLALRGFLLTTTETDCTGAFDWTQTKAAWPTNIPVPKGNSVVGVVGMVKAAISDCAISHKATLADDSKLPSFIEYDAQWNILMLMVTSDTPTGTYNVKVTAYNNDKVTVFKQDSWTKSFTIVADNYVQGGLVAGGTVTADSIYNG